MAKSPDPQTLNLLNKYKFNVPKEKTVWNCQGTWVLLFQYIEEIGRQAKVYIESLEPVELNTEKRIAVIKCVAQTDKQKVITYGESSPHNTFNKYPVAMAEKRAKGRAILKLAGLHGDFYEDEFSVDEKPTEKKSTNTTKNESSSSSSSALPKDWKSKTLVEQVQYFFAEIDKASDPEQLEQIKQPFTEWYDDLARDSKKEIVEALKKKVKEFKK
tara:strand:- start:1655 stop:2299 length:645 start_codon:yes stop_codon:yes gene_type:complete